MATSLLAVPQPSIAAVTVPGAPTNVAGSSGDGEVYLSWVAPVNDGGSSITGYRVQVSTSSGSGFADVAAGTCLPTITETQSRVRCDAGGLSNGTQYFFKVLAINSAGNSSYSTASAAVTPAAGSNQLVVLNDGGGTSSSNGLKFTYGAGNYQVTRLGTGQLYSQTTLPTAPSSSTFLYNGTFLRVDTTLIGPCTSGSARTITGITGSGTVATVTTSGANGFTVGTLVTITGVTPAGYNTAGAIVTSVNTATRSFTIESAETAAFVSGGTAVGSSTCPAGTRTSTPMANQRGWSSITTTGGSVNSVVNGTGTVVSKLAWTDPLSSLTYLVKLRFDYTAGDPFVTQSITLAVPPGNATACAGAPCEVKLYLGIDTYLSGSDKGAGFKVSDRNNNVFLVGVRSASGITEGLRWRSGPYWSGYVSGAYACVFTANSCGGGYIPTDGSGAIGAGGNMWTGSAAIDARPDTDNGIGAMWDTPNIAGVYDYSLDVLFAIAPVVSTVSLPIAYTCAAYSQTLTATSGTGVYTDWDITSGTLPAGLSLNSATGVISGTPTAAASNDIEVTVTDSNFFVSQPMPLTMTVQYGVPVVTTSSLPAGIPSAPYSQTLAAICGSGTAKTWAITSGSLPDGLTLDPATGVISGKPTLAGVGTSNFTVTATDSSGTSVAKALYIVIGPGPTITTSALPNGMVGSPYLQTLAATGGSNVFDKWEITLGALPAGLTLNEATGTISGTPTATGTSSIQFTVIDSLGNTAVRTLSLTIGTPPTPTTCTTPSQGATGSAQNSNIPAGGVPPGGIVALSGCDPVPVIVTPEPVALVVTSPAFTMRLEGRGDTGDPLALIGKSVLRLESQPAWGDGMVPPTAVVSGTGALASSTVKLFILPARYLGEVPVDSAGNFNGSVPIPPGISPGDYTLQANALTPDSQVRSLSIGVLVTSTARPDEVVSGETTVFFKAMSAKLTKKAKAELRRLADDVGSGDVSSVVLGYVQQAGSNANNKSLSTARAKAVARYLRGLGLYGDYVIQGRGINERHRGPSGRRVNVAVVMTP